MRSDIRVLRASAEPRDRVNRRRADRWLALARRKLRTAGGAEPRDRLTAGARADASRSGSVRGAGGAEM